MQTTDIESELTGRASENINRLRNKLIDTRSFLHKVMNNYPGVKEHINDLEGLFNCGLITLYSAIERIKVGEVVIDDHKYGKSLNFRSRGLGQDACSSCFVCGVKSVGMIDNISAFIDSEADGCVIRGWFGDRAWIDYRPDEPNWIQMKFGTCKAHIKSLNYLHSISAWYGVLREKDVQDSKNLYKE